MSKTNMAYAATAVSAAVLLCTIAVLAAPQQSADDPMLLQELSLMPVMNVVCEMEEFVTFKMPVAKNRTTCHACLRDCLDVSACLKNCQLNITPGQTQAITMPFMNPTCAAMQTCYHGGCDSAGAAFVAGMTGAQVAQAVRDVSFTPE